MKSKLNKFSKNNKSISKLKSKLKKSLKPRRNHKKTRKSHNNKKKAFDRFKYSNPALSSSSLALGLA